MKSAGAASVPRTAEPRSVDVPPTEMSPEMATLGASVVPSVTLASPVSARPPAKLPPMVRTPEPSDPSTWIRPVPLEAVKAPVASVAAPAPCWISRKPPFSVIGRPPRMLPFADSTMR